MDSKDLTVEVLQDFVQTLVLSDLRNDLFHAVYMRERSEIDMKWHHQQNVLNMTPMRVKTISCEITRNAKYRATTARSSRDCVVAPWYCESQRMTMGRKKPNRAETAGGRTPEMNVKVPGDDFDQS